MLPALSMSFLEKTEGQVNNPVKQGKKLPMAPAQTSSSSMSSKRAPTWEMISTDYVPVTTVCRDA